MRVFVLIERWCDLNPALGVTSGNSNILGSLEDSGLAEITPFFYDEYLHNHGHAVDDHFLEAVRRDKPEVIVVNYYPFADDPRNIKKETLQTVKSLNVPIVFVWFDFVHTHIRNLAISLLEFSTVSVVIDVMGTDEFLHLWVPQDGRIFNDPGLSRDIPVSFVGSQYQDRRIMLDYVDQHLPVFRSGGQREHRLSLEEYAEVLKRSKISINFSAKGNVHQAKSRIYETLSCGSLLLEHDTEPIRHWFRPMEHYVPFSDQHDLVNKINYYLANEDERVALALAGHKEMQHYSSREWWRRVFECCQ